MSERGGELIRKGDHFRVRFLWTLVADRRRVRFAFQLLWLMAKLVVAFHSPYRFSHLIHQYPDLLTSRIALDSAVSSRSTLPRNESVQPLVAPAPRCRANLVVVVAAAGRQRRQEVCNEDGRQ